ncbi:24777_t:CDS:2 [Gigaspora margarita]|uniref:24777_t:CDS:1 n=1 Tax=Gigaspora margarita TaxID=4874 RepID=A0ABN7VYC2_GIGMA|nr:24777_t:CDS:2 [Gigaspora margarita]
MLGPVMLASGEKNHDLKKYIDIATEYLTKWLEAHALSEATASAVATFLIEDIICQHGIPRNSYWTKKNFSQTNWLIIFAANSIPI